MKKETFTLDYEYEIEYEYAIVKISHKWRFQGPCSSYWF